MVGRVWVKRDDLTGLSLKMTFPLGNTSTTYAVLMNEPSVAYGVELFYSNISCWSLMHGQAIAVHRVLLSGCKGDFS